MKNKTIILQKKLLLLATSIGLASLATGSAEVVAWWRFEGPSGALVSEVNSPALDAALPPGRSSIDIKDRPAQTISDGVGGTPYSNSSSLHQIGEMIASPIEDPTSIVFLNNILINQSTSWTWEAFVKKIDQKNYGILFGNGDNQGNGIQFDLGADGLTFRFTSNKKSYGESQIELETWNHVAVVAEAQGAKTWNVIVYINYKVVAQHEDVQFNETKTAYSIGGPQNTLNGWLDEIRISNEALQPEQMLRMD